MQRRFIVLASLVFLAFGCSSGGSTSCDSYVGNWTGHYNLAISKAGPDYFIRMTGSGIEDNQAAKCVGGELSTGGPPGTAKLLGDTLLYAGYQFTRSQ
ncbi:MAG: hypothetical protein JWR84_1323 [Caulobacter sp.]|nr:hypothetical protein [Caulobacter sp.]